MLRPRLLLLIIGLSGLIGTAIPGAAMPLSPKAQHRLRALPEEEQRELLARPDWIRSPPPSNAGDRIEAASVLVLLVDFSDNPADPAHPPYRYSDLLLSEDLLDPGSMRDYYDEISYGQFTLDGLIHPAWLRMPRPYAYYADGQRGLGTYPRNARKLVEDAIAAADPGLDFSLYDRDEDGMVDGLFVVHAGPGFEETLDPDMIHSHMSIGLNAATQDGVIVDLYSVEPEEHSDGRLISIGVFCHEFGHSLGLQDLYDLDYDSAGAGNWSLMAGGAWGGDGNHPERPSQMLAWSKSRVGWLVPTPVTVSGPLTIGNLTNLPEAVRLVPTGREYFLLECRHQSGWDAHLPGSGLVVTHIERQSPDNNHQSCGPGEIHALLAVEQADGLCDLEENRGRGDAGDPFPGSTGNTTFDTDSLPNSRTYEDLPTWVRLTGIHETGSEEIALEVELEPTTPFLAFHSVVGDDSIGGDGDGWLEGGESVQMAVTLKNHGLPLEGVQASLSCASPHITVLDGSADFGSFAAQEQKDSGADDFRITLAPDVPRGSQAIFELTLSGAESYGTSLEFDVLMAPLPLTDEPVWTTELPLWHTALTLGDVDGDEDLDLVRGGVGEQLHLHRNLEGTLEESPSWVSTDATQDWPTRLFLTDLTGDDLPDLVVLNREFNGGPGPIQVYLNSVSGFANDPSWTSAGAHRAGGGAMGDLTGDGIPDLYVACQDEPDHLYRGLAQGSFESVWSTTGASPGADAVMGDLDGDGDLDLVVGGLDRLELYSNQGGTLPAIPTWTTTSELTVESLALGDIDLDGDLDLLVGQVDDQCLLLDNQGGTPQEPPAWASLQAATTHVLLVRDLDRDSYPELIMGNLAGIGVPQGSQNHIHANLAGELTPYAAWTSRQAGATFGADLGDIDLDGDIDLVVADLVEPIGLHENLLDPHGCELWMPAHHFTPGAPCSLRADWLNPFGPTPNVVAFVVLGVLGEYYFAPSWVHYDPPDHPDIDAYLIPTLPVGRTRTQVIPEFAWPSGTGSLGGLSFYGAMVDPTGTMLWGELDRWEFAFSE